MKKIHKLNLMIVIILLSLIFFALYLRHITASEVTFSFASRLRSYIYIGIISAWYISLKMRIVEKKNSETFMCGGTVDDFLDGCKNNKIWQYE